MTYNLIITDEADERMQNLLHHLLHHIKNEQAAVHFIENLEKIYSLLEDNPFQFQKCTDENLASKHYRKAIFSEMNYLLIYKIQCKDVYILGIFHESEQYSDKI